MYSSALLLAPARAPGLPHRPLWERGLRHLAHALHVWRRRRAYRRLYDLSDHLLDDIGVTRGEVEIAAQRPLRENAALELRALSKMRRDLGQ